MYTLLQIDDNVYIIFNKLWNYPECTYDITPLLIERCLLRQTVGHFKCSRNSNVYIIFYLIFSHLKHTSILAFTSHRFQRTLTKFGSLTHPHCLSGADMKAQSQRS